MPILKLLFQKRNFQNTLSKKTLSRKGIFKIATKTNKTEYFLYFLE